MSADGSAAIEGEGMSRSRSGSLASSADVSADGVGTAAMGGEREGGTALSGPPLSEATNTSSETAKVASKAPRSKIPTVRRTSRRTRVGGV